MKRLAPVILLAALALAWPASTFAGSASDETNKASKADKSAKADKADKADKAHKAEKDGSASGAPDASKPDATPKDAAAAAAQTAPANQAKPAAATEERDDAVFNPAQPDFTLITLPTGLRLPQYKSAFRVTHRFSRPLGQGDFGDLAADLFSLDSSAQIGLEFRFGLWRGLQVGINRTNDRDIEFFAQYDVFQQSDRLPVGLAVIGTVDGTNNFRSTTDSTGTKISASKSPGVGAIVSRTFTKYGAVYFEPIFVNNTNPLPKELADHNNTFLIGLGGRVQFYKNTYFVLEVVPRVSGFKGADGDVERINPVSFAIEKHVGGHMFQINFSNSFATTMAPIARGGPSGKDWYLGFNITRKFY